MSISGIKPAFEHIQKITQQTQPQGQQNGTQGSEKGSFQDMFSDAMKEVNQLQLKADSQIENLILGKGGVNTHDAMIALEKADVAFQLMNQVRSKIVQAYEQVIRTQI